MKRTKSLFAAVLGAAVIGLFGLGSCAKSSNEKPAEEQAPSQEMNLCSVELYDVAELLPSDIAFSWEPYNDRGSFYVLVALKK